jgi:hypothetical protein
MAAPSSEEDGLLREWAPLTDLLQQIPLRAQRGLFTHNLNLTCVDTLPEFIAVGTNLGLVYWYNRKTGDLQRLRCEVNLFMEYLRNEGGSSRLIGWIKCCLSS